MEKKNTMLLTIIAVATLLVAVVGATFAYFTAQNGASGSTTATVTTETIGAITVSNEDPALYLDLTAAQMQEGVTGSYWATKIKGAEPATNYASADKAVIAKLNVSGGGEETIYSCNFKITVDKTDVTLAYGDAAVVFALENNAEILGVTSGREIDYTTLLNEYTVNFTRVGDTEEDLPLVSVSMRVSNTEVEQGFAGETLTTTFTSSDLECEVVDESDVKTLSGTWRFNDELSVPSTDLEQELNFTSSINYQGMLIETGHSTIRVEDMSDGSNSWLEVNYTTISLNPNPGLTLPSGMYVYTTSPWSDNIGWGVEAADYDKGIQIITFPTEQETSDEFYEWFIANAKPVIEVNELPTENIDTNAIYKTYEYTAIDSTDTTTIKAGTYRFNDVIVGPELNGTYDINLSVISQEIVLTQEYVDLAESELGLVGLQAGQYVVTPRFQQIRVYMSDEYNIVEYWEKDFVVEPYSDVAYAFFQVIITGNEVYHTLNGGWFEGLFDWQTINITSEQEVSDEFVTWFIANAKVRGDAKYHQYVAGSWIEQ